MRVGTLKQKHTHSATGEIKFWRRVQCACWIVRLDLILQAQGYRVGHFSVNISYLQSSHELLSKQRRRVWKVRVVLCLYSLREKMWNLILHLLMLMSIITTSAEFLSKYHNHEEMTEKLRNLVEKHSDILSMYNLTETSIQGKIN